MPTIDLSPEATDLLRVIAQLHERHQVATVQAAAIGARQSYMGAYDLVNELFTAGLLAHDLRLTDDGRKAIA